jgi:hypothetical protein
MKAREKRRRRQRRKENARARWAAGIRRRYDVAVEVLGHMWLLDEAKT